MQNGSQAIANLIDSLSTSEMRELGTDVTLYDSTGEPITNDHEKQLVIATHSAGDLIRYAKKNPPQRIIAGLLNVGDILLLHGSEESFKSVFVLQIAESIATRHRLLNHWPIPKPYKVGVIETEIHEVMLGERLGKMFPGGNPPENICFLAEEALRQWRKENMNGKFRFVQNWINEQGIEVLMLDIASDFFRGNDNPSEERSVGTFFDQLRNLKVKARVIVRHDRKRPQQQIEGTDSNPNEQIRGSGEWKEDPEVILYLDRLDRRTNKVTFEVGKLRYGQKPDPWMLWFDAGTFRLTALPPVVAVLGSDTRSRQEIISACEERFNLGERMVDRMLGDIGEYLEEAQAGHQKTFKVDPQRSLKAPWAAFFFGSAEKRA